MYYLWKCKRCGSVERNPRFDMITGEKRCAKCTCSVVPFEEVWNSENDRLITEKLGVSLLRADGTIKTFSELIDEIRNKFVDEKETVINLECDISEEEKTLFVQANCFMKDEWIEEEQKRLQELTGMKVCILKANFSYIGVE